MEAKFKKGDKVKVIKYGHLIWEHKSSEALVSAFPTVFEDDTFRYLDMCPVEVGKTGTVTKISLVQGIYNYTLKGQVNKKAWYDEQQLELINTENDNNN